MTQKFCYFHSCVKWVKYFYSFLFSYYLILSLCFKICLLDHKIFFIIPKRSLNAFYYYFYYVFWFKIILTLFYFTAISTSQILQLGLFFLFVFYLKLTVFLKTYIFPYFFRKHTYQHMHWIYLISWFSDCYYLCDYMLVLIYLNCVYLFYSFHMAISDEVPS